jgi:hypothetical protein
MTTKRITVQEFRAAGYCVTGQKEMCKLVGWDFRDLVRNGLSVEDAQKIPGIEAIVNDVLKRRKANDP